MIYDDKCLPDPNVVLWSGRILYFRPGKHMNTYVMRTATAHIGSVLREKTATEALNPVRMT